MPAFDEDMSNGSNSSDSSDVVEYNTGLRILLAVFELFVSGFCLFIVIYLSIRLKKGAWDSPTKRFGQIFNVYFSFTFIFYAAANFMIAFNFMYGFLIGYIAYSFFCVSFLYFTVTYSALSLQIFTPLLPEKLRLCLQNTHCVKVTEGMLHAFFLLSLISFSVLLNYNSNSGYIIINTISFFFSILFILFSVFFIIAFVFLMKFFKKHNINEKPIKHIIIKLILLLNCIAFIIISLVATIKFNWLLVFVQVILYFILSISVVSLNHPLDIWCCMYCFRKSPTYGPSLPVNATEGQQTSPISVWDHSNVPSYTMTNLPIEMSDCRSDYI